MRGASPKDPVRIVLVRPRDPNNIGAAARAMANFGLADLRVVAPYPPVWREAKSAVGAEPLLRAARETASIADAVAGCRHVLATSAVKGRRPGLPVLDLAGWQPPAGPVAILFGPEKTGLSGDDLSHASAILRAPTVAGCPSMNLAAAVAVVCYQSRRVAVAPAVEGPLAARAELKDKLREGLEALARREGWPEGGRLRALKAAVYRSNLSDAEAGMALELLRRLR